MEQRTGRTSLNAFAAACAGIGFAPGQIQVGDDFRIRATSGNVLGASAFHVPAYSHTSRAKDTTVVVQSEQSMGIVRVPSWKDVVVTDVIHAVRIGKRLQFAMAIGDTNGANMIALGEKQFE